MSFAEDNQNDQIVFPYNQNDNQQSNINGQNISSIRETVITRSGRRSKPPSYLKDYVKLNESLRFFLKSEHLHCFEY